MAIDESVGVETTSPEKSSGVQASSIKDGKTAALDGAVQFVTAHQDLPPMTAEIEKRIKKKIDGWMIPLVRCALRSLRKLY